MNVQLLSLTCCELSQVFNEELCATLISLITNFWPDTW